MRRFVGALCFGLSLLVATASSAATIEPIKGDLSINRGQGFQKVDGIIEAKEGDAVMVSPDGSAGVTYPDGCKVSLEPGMVMTIAALSPCASRSYAREQDFNKAGLVYWGIIIGVSGGVIYEITQATKTTTPASP